ncbi:putative glutamine amidotransferase [Oceanicella actignis]|uniref:Putative glutamine amidotransferase n=1 Tax=Oceanicella actignis TaxID=1189325 RepID=A0A1M7S1X4_9RHOB|nr:putative glutamine amidotransferase [Oceanicella actignis]SHN52375.1 putative glutamine amidotransferase [Oceanicella actignis]
MSAASSPRRPVVGVTKGRGRGWALWAFAALSLRLHGARPRRIEPPFSPEAARGLDALIVGGGDDIGATLYGGEPAPDMRIDPERDALELRLLEEAWRRHLPVLGICRGAQMLNVFLGGTLHADIAQAYPHARRLRTPLPRKHVRLAPGTRLARIIGDEAIVVNALHHQSIDRLGQGLRVAARDEYGIVQAVEHRGRLLRIGVQWHPEFLFYARKHRRLFAALTDAARAHAATAA